MAKHVGDIENRNKRLFDLLFRHQVYLEGFKAGLNREHRFLLRKLYDLFALFMARSRYANLGEYSLAQINGFIRQFQREQVKQYNIYTDKLIRELKQFVNTDTDLMIQIHDESSNRDIPEIKTESLFNKITAEPVPANGLLAQDQIKAFGNMAVAQVSAIIRRGYANGWTPQQTLEMIVGNSSNNFRDGLFSRLAVQAASMLATVTQHISAGVQQEVAAKLYEKYKWVSVLDNRTTLICRSRDGVIYIYGEGPQPPAHWNCRSKTVPLIPGDQEFAIPKSFVTWLLDQPEGFQNDVLGPAKFANLRNGSLKVTDFTSLSTTKPLTLAEFAAKIRYILEP